MKELLTVLLLAGGCLAAEAQDTTRTHIPGTRLSLVIPQGYHLDADKRTLVSNTSDRAIFRIIHSNTPLSKFREQYAEELQMKRYEGSYFKDTAMGRRKAFYAWANIMIDGLKYRKLIIGIQMDTGSAMFQGEYPEVMPWHGPVFFRIAFSVRFHPESPYALARYLGFSLDTVGTGFRYKPGHLSSGSISIVPVDLKDPGKEPDCYFFAAHLNTYGQPTMDWREQFDEWLSDTRKYYKVRPGTIKDATVDGLPALQCECRGQNAGKDEVILFTMAFEPNGFYVISGRTNYNQAEFLPKFYTLTNRFRRKFSN